MHLRLNSERSRSILDAGHRVGCSCTRSPLMTGRGSAKSVSKTEPLRRSSAEEMAITSRAASLRSSNSMAGAFLANIARRRLIISDARLASRMVRRTVSAAPAILGGSSANMRAQVLALVRIPEIG
jgi:hypothetical protein